MKPGFIDVITYGNPPTEIPPADGRTSGRRLALAQWLLSPQNPLTARVIVNRIWQNHFGRGIVATLENFGKMGEPPTHPELLDWLAVEFMNRGWSIKQINRLMMTSEAYQMASAFDDAADAKNDPENRYLWRFRAAAARRRDRPRQHPGRRRQHQSDDRRRTDLPVICRRTFSPASSAASGRTRRTGPAAWRRSVYVYQQRSLPFPMFDRSSTIRT